MSLHYILLLQDVQNEIHEITNTAIQYLTTVDISDTKFTHVKNNTF
jgi:hypothetical protein